MKFKNKLIYIGSIAATVAPIAAVVSCGTKSNTGDEDNSTNQNITDKINSAGSLYENQYDYNKLLKQDASTYDANKGVLTVDLAALRKFPDSYPINHNEFNSQVWGELTKLSVKNQLIAKGVSPTDAQKEMKNISPTSAPLAVQTNAIYYSYFDKATPKADGTKDDIKPGFYHIRPESDKDILATDAHTLSWNRAGEGAGIIDSLKDLISKAALGANKLVNGDQLLMNTCSNKNLIQLFQKQTVYTYYNEYEEYDDDDNFIGTKKLDDPGFYLEEPTEVDGSGYLNDTYHPNDSIYLTPEQNKLDPLKIKGVGDGFFEFPTYTEDSSSYDQDYDEYSAKESTSVRYLNTNTDAPAWGGSTGRDRSYGDAYSWDPISPISVKHILSNPHKTQLFDKDEVGYETKIHDTFDISDTNKDALEFLQPESKWIVPRKMFGESYSIDLETTSLSYNDKRFELTAYAKRNMSSSFKESFYNKDDFKFLDTDSLHWKDTTESFNTTLVPTTLQKILITSDLNGYDGIMKANYDGKVFTLCTKYDDADKTGIPGELQGFYLKRPTNEDEARKVMFDMAGTGNNIDGNAIKAIPHQLSKFNTPVKIIVNNKPTTVKYWNPTNIDTISIEMKLVSSENFHTKSGFEFTTMPTPPADQTDKKVTTQQDRGFTPESIAGSWQSTLSSGTVGSDLNLYDFADFIEVKGNNDYYYQHEFFNTDENGKTINLKAMTNEERDAYRLPSILRGFYKNGSILSLEEYNKDKDLYIENSLNSGTNHDRLIFNGMNGAKGKVSYKGVTYENKSISGMIAHTTWSPIISEKDPMYGEKQAKEWKVTDDDGTVTRTIALPNDYFSYEQVDFGEAIFSNDETIVQFGKEVNHIPFEDLKTIKFVWNEEALGTIDNVEYSKFQDLMKVIKSTKLFEGNFQTVIKNIGFDGKLNFHNVGEDFFGKAEGDYSASIMGKLAKELGKYTELKVTKEVTTTKGGNKDA